MGQKPHAYTSSKHRVKEHQASTPYEGETLHHSYLCVKQKGAHSTTPYSFQTTSKFNCRGLHQVLRHRGAVSLSPPIPTQLEQGEGVQKAQSASSTSLHTHKATVLSSYSMLYYKRTFQLH